MCPINSDQVKVVAPAVSVAKKPRSKMVPVEIITRDVFERFNLPTYLKVGESGSITIGFGHFNDEKIGRDHQFKIAIERPRQTAEELRQMVADWYRLRTLARTSSGNERDDAQEAFNALKARFLDIIAQPALAEFVTPNLWILHPLPAETEVHASLLVYTTFEDDATIKIPENDGLMHGKFGENGHVVAVVITTDQTIVLMTPNGHTFRVPVDIPNGMPTVDEIFPPDAVGRHDDDTPAANDGSESTREEPGSGREEVPFVLPDRRHRGSRKPSAVGAGTGRGKGSRRVDPNDVEDE